MSGCICAGRRCFVRDNSCWTGRPLAVFTFRSVCTWMSNQQVLDVQQPMRRKRTVGGRLGLAGGELLSWGDCWRTLPATAACCLCSCSVSCRRASLKSASAVNNRVRWGDLAHNADESFLHRLSARTTERKILNVTHSVTNTTIAATMRVDGLRNWTAILAFLNKRDLCVNPFTVEGHGEWRTMDVAVAGTCRYVGMLPSEPFFGSGFGLPLVVVDHADVSSAHVHQIQSTSSTSLNLPSQHHQPASAASTSVSKKSRPMDLLRWFSTYVWRFVPGRKLLREVERMFKSLLWRCTRTRKITYHHHLIIIFICSDKNTWCKQRAHDKTWTGQQGGKTTGTTLTAALEKVVCCMFSVTLSLLTNWLHQLKRNFCPVIYSHQNKLPETIRKLSLVKV